MTYSYHFYAVHEDSDGESVILDGLLQSDQQILTFVDYESLKRTLTDGKGTIRGSIDTSRLNPDNIVIKSLTYLGSDGKE